jgi:putative ubiquitin-RnfH superfamily antitoxin RatB of RatAB toxin-antitoxin module
MAKAEDLAVRVVYALPERQVIVQLRVPPRTTVVDAVSRSGLLERFPEIATRPITCAVYGQTVADSYEVRSGDRIEILRPLQVDPKVSRRQAAARARARKEKPRGA